MLENVVYETVQTVTAQAHQPPSGAGMLAVYRPLSLNPETGAQSAGSLEQPHAFITGMDVHSGRYYSHNAVIYLAKADMIPCACRRIRRAGGSGRGLREATDCSRSPTHCFYKVLVISCRSYLRSKIFQ